MITVVKHLFPKDNAVFFNRDKSDKFLDFTLQEMLKACSKLENYKVPCPGNIPPEVIEVVAKLKPDCILPVNNTLANDKTFPTVWKVARLVLLKRENLWITPLHLDLYV